MQIAALLALLPLLAAAVPAVAEAPALLLLKEGFPAGLYAISATRGGGPALRQCLASPELILFGNPSGAPPGCRLTVVEDTTDRAILSWSCSNGSSGRSEVRRDHAGLFVSQIQGVSGRLPYVLRRSFLLIGPCPADQSKPRSPEGGSAR